MKYLHAYDGKDEVKNPQGKDVGDSKGKTEDDTQDARPASSIN